MRKMMHLNPGFKDILISTTIVCAYTALVIALTCLQLHVRHTNWAALSALRWDASWYQSIRAWGYHFDPTTNSNVAFLPLFPYLWRCTGLGTAGICLLNFFLFLAGVVMLWRCFPSSVKTRSLALSCSLLLFFLVPYSESLFFLFAALMLSGLKRDALWPTLAGLTGMGLTRSVGIVFCPAFLVLATMLFRQEGFSDRTHRCVLYSGYSLAVMGVVFWIQYLQTGVWMAFSKAQRFWYSSFRMPDIPFSTWDVSSPNNRFVEQFSLFLCIIALITC